jgi:group I intron endonuclease
MGDIYMIKNKLNNKSYIGQCLKYLSSGKKYGYLNRWKKHVYCSKNKPECRLIANAISKYNEENFEVILLDECPIELLNDKEIYYIELYNTLSPNGYNLMSGGGNGRKHSEETKKLMSITRTGKKHTEETKRKIAEKNKNQIKSEETRKLLSDIGKFRDMKPENKERLLKHFEKLNIQALPMYVTYRYSKNGNEGFCVRKHPTLPNKQFTSKNETIETKYNKILNYLNSR